MINETIDNLIKEAMLSHNNKERDVLRLIKTEFLKYQTSKEGAGHHIDDATEFKILKKMVDQRKDAIEQYKKYNKPALAKAETEEMLIIQKYLPKEASSDEITSVVETIINNYTVEHSGEKLTMKQMGMIIKDAKASCPTADGKLLSSIVKTKLS